MKEKKYNLTKALSWYMIGSFFIKAVNFFMLKIFTGLMSTTDYGIFGIYQSYLNVFEMIVLFGTAHTIKMIKYDEKYDYGKYISSIIFIPLLGTVFFTLILSIIACFTKQFVALPIEIWYAILLSAGFLAISNIIAGKLILEGEYKKYICYSLINTVLNMGISLLLCFTLFKNKDVYWARILGTLFANIGSCIYVCFFIKIQIPNLQYIKKGILLGAPLLVHSVATQILVQTDKVAISHLSSYAAVGIYTAAASIVVIPMTILTSIESSWSPWFFESLSRAKYKEIKKKNTEILLLFAAGLVLFILGSPEVVRFMTDSDYWDAIYVLIPLTTAAFAEMIYIIPLNLELYYKKSKAIWIYTSMVVVINVAFDVLFISMFGYQMAAYVTCFARILLFLLHYIRAKRIDHHEIMDLKVVLLSLVGLLAVDRATVFFIHCWPIRWCVIVITAGLIGVYLIYQYKNSKRGEAV